MLRHTMCPQSEQVISSPEPAGIIRLDRKVGMHTLRKGAAMSLQLFELVPATPSREAAEALIAQVSQAVEAAGASVLDVAGHRQPRNASSPSSSSPPTTSTA